jgi:hypothetical protein
VAIVEVMVAPSQYSIRVNMKRSSLIKYFVFLNYLFKINNFL